MYVRMSRKEGKSGQTARETGPTEHFIRASKSNDEEIVCTSKTSIVGFWGSKAVNWSVVEENGTQKGLSGKSTQEKKLQKKLDRKLGRYLTFGQRKEKETSEPKDKKEEFEQFACDPTDPYTISESPDQNNQQF